MFIKSPAMILSNQALSDPRPASSDELCVHDVQRNLHEIWPPSGSYSPPPSQYVGSLDEVMALSPLLPVSQARSAWWLGGSAYFRTSARGRPGGGSDTIIMWSNLQIYSDENYLTLSITHAWRVCSLVLQKGGILRPPGKRPSAPSPNYSTTQSPTKVPRKW